MTNVIRHLERQPKAFLLALALGIVAVMGLFDRFTGPDFAFSIFYLLPIVLVTWFVGRWEGVLISIVSAALWFVNNATAGHSYSHPAIPYWNGTIEFSFYLIIASLLSALKDSLEHEKAMEQEALTREIKIAKEVQTRLLPQMLPPMRTLDYTATCQAARDVSGDYYDFLRLGSDTLGIVVGDISGKGISAALLTASLQALLRSQATLYGNAPADLINQINRLMCMWTDEGRFATLFYGLYEDSHRRLTYVNAGHNPPILFRPARPVGRQVSPHSDADGASPGPFGVSTCEMRRLKTGGTVVGLLPDVVYQQETVQMRPGDILLIFTDGLSEAVSVAQEEFGEKRLAALVAAHLYLSTVELRDLILAELANFARGARQPDDLTLVIAKVT
jgi:sigma-B regulation protein RsbU (phosphoserine phosphatase)